MARLVRKHSQTPLWLLSYADTATLILCFMVLLTSLSVIDERLKHEILGSVNKQYASSLVIPLPDDAEAFDLAKLQEGLGEKQIHGRDFTFLKEQALSDELGDMVFQENSYVQIVSFSESALFEPGTTRLSAQGERALDRILPLLVEIQYPLLVAGHASARMDEEGPTYSIAEDEENPSWKIGFERAFAVYAYMKNAGVPAQQMSMESFGEYRPRVSMQTPLGRTKNRRVDLILDKRNARIGEKIKKSQQRDKPEKPVHEIDGFQFDLSFPGQTLEEDQGGGRHQNRQGRSVEGQQDSWLKSRNFQEHSFLGNLDRLKGNQNNDKVGSSEQLRSSEKMAVQEISSALALVEMPAILKSSARRDKTSHLGVSKGFGLCTEGGFKGASASEEKNHVSRVGKDVFRQRVFTSPAGYWRAQNV